MPLYFSPEETLGIWTHLAGLIAAGGVLLFAIGLRLRLAHAGISGRFDLHVAPARGFIRPRASAASAPRRLLSLFSPLLPLVFSLADATQGLLPKRQIDRIRANLALAGMPYSRQLSQFLAAKAALALALALAIGLSQARIGAPAPRTMVGALMAGVVGFYLPGIWLGRRIARRRQLIVKALPDALDLLSISVSAGLGFDGAMQEVVQRWRNPLTEEFGAVLRDLKLGTSRRDALRDLARRTGVEEIISFVAAVVQADELGTPMKDVLHIQAEQMRQRRRHKAEESARKAVIKMLVPMVMFIFPSLFIVLIGPAVPMLAMLRGVR